MDLMPGHDGDVKQIEAEFAELQFEHFTHEDALTLGLDLAERIEEADCPMACAVYFGEQNVFRYGCVGSSAENDDFIRRKRNTVLKYKEPSFLVGQRLAEVGKNFYAETGLAEDEYVCFGGGYPIMVSGEIVAMAFTSGAPHEVDHQILVDALRSAKEA